MAKKPESVLFQRLKENLSGCHFTRLESRVGLGVPDCLIAFKGPGVFVMLELKVVQRGKKVNMSAHQVAFHVKHADLGCPTFILVQYHPPGTAHAQFSELRLYRGSQAIELATCGIDTTPIGLWPYKAVQWEMLRMYLLDAVD